MDRAALFVDGSNMLYTQRFLGWSIDWKRLREYFAERYNLVSANYYITYKELSDEQIRFQTFLATNGYVVRKKELKKITDRETGEKIYKGNLDIELVVDALTSIDRYDVCILFSGDGDFLPLIRALKSSGKVVHAYSTKGLSAIELVAELGMDFHDLQELRPEIEFTERTNGVMDRKPAEPSDPDSIPTEGEVFTGKPLFIKPYGVFLSNPWNVKALLHISKLGIQQHINNLSDIIRQEDDFKVEVISVKLTPEGYEVGLKLVDEALQNELHQRLASLLPEES